MSDHRTNGYLSSILAKAANDPSHPEYATATEYYTHFRNMEGVFFREVHPYVDMGLAMREVQMAAKEGQIPNVFTVHGCRHVSDLIKSLDKFARELEGSTTEAISVIEAYILLCAAHVHDAANTKEREGHPERCNEVITKRIALFDSVASQQIYDVARVHGGKHSEYGKDTFRDLNADNRTSPRLPLLAAYLRLSDELSENEDRVPDSVVEEHPVSPESQLAHAYARSFANFEICNESLSIVYNVYPREHDLEVEINESDVSFYDFLEMKINTIENEARYCSQYGRPALHINDVTITINQYEGPRPSRLKSKETFALYLNQGYPTSTAPLCERSPELVSKGIVNLRECFNAV